MKTNTDLEFRKNLLLASASLHTRPPTDIVRANCARVLRHALFAANLWDEHYQKGQSAAFHGCYDDFPLVEVWYMTLIEMTHHEPESERLLEGAGNIMIPSQAAGASFTACWLTPAGQIAAAQILLQHPEWREKLLQEQPPPCPIR